MNTADTGIVWGDDERPFLRVARNVATRYVAVAIDALLGLFVLPFNVHHLGPAAYGLWMLTASVTVYFSVLDLGFGSSVTKFVAQYRAHRDARSLNEIVSTVLVVFMVTGALAYLIFCGIAFNVDRIFKLTPEQVITARQLTLIIGVYIAISFPAGVFGGVINAFQRYDVNAIVGIGSSIVVAVVNVVMLLAGYSLVELVAATTAVRIGTLVLYRWNAYAIFPALSARPSLFRWARIRELSTFSIYLSMIDWAAKLNYSADVMIIGAFMSSTAVAVWTVPQRLAEVMQRLTNQASSVIFPVVVDSHAGQKTEQLRAVFLRGTLFTLVTVMPLVTALFLLSGPLIRSWVGPQFEQSIPIARVLLIVMAIRVGNSTATTVLKGASGHRFLAMTNVAMAIANITLSVILIQRYGLVGQAIGTLVPVSIGSIAVLWPAACRRVGIHPVSAFWEAVWPALWPAAVMALVVVGVRDAMPERLYAVGVAGAVGSVVYLVTFLAFAVKAHERRTVMARLVELARGRGRIPAAA